LTAALLVAKTLEPTVDELSVRGALVDLRDRFVAGFPQGADPRSLVGFLRDEGFKASDNQQSLDASRIDKVLSSRRGIPITLSIPYLMVGRALGMTTQGINFPGHFLMSANGALIDPLSAELLTRSDIDRWLTESNLTHLGANALAPASPDDVAVRMFNNVKAIYAARGDFVDALALIDIQLALVTDVGPLHLERSELWFRLGDPAAAAAVLEEARIGLAGTRWEAEIDKRLKRLVGQPRSTIH
jgi:regulator of sirC expression with transglutaminase-like and TPR domain